MERGTQCQYNHSPRLTQVCLVNVFHPIGQDGERDNEEVELEDPFPLLRRVIVGKPLDLPPSLAVHRGIGHCDG